jgi:DNA-binding PadR family transcriptional regulator
VGKKLTQKQFVALTLLVRYKEMYGLDLTEQSEGQIKLGTVYTILHQLEDMGLVTSRQEENPQPETRIPRRLYRATPEGEEKCKEERKGFMDLVKLIIRSA